MVEYEGKRQDRSGKESLSEVDKRLKISGRSAGMDTGTSAVAQRGGPVLSSPVTAHIRVVNKRARRLVETALDVIDRAVVPIDRRCEYGIWHGRSDGRHSSRSDPPTTARPLSSERRNNKLITSQSGGTPIRAPATCRHKHSAQRKTLTQAPPVLLCPCNKQNTRLIRPPALGAIRPPI